MRQLVSAVLALLTSSPKPQMSGQPVGVDDSTWLASHATTALTKTFVAAGLDAREGRAGVTVSGHTVAVTAHVNNRVQQQSEYILAAQFEISVDGTRLPNLVTGTIGVGDTPLSARDTTGAEWATQYGVPIGFALAASFGALEASVTSSPLAAFHRKVEVEGQLLFHGPPGVRGQVKQAAAVSSDEFVRRVARLVVQSLPRQDPAGAYHTALVQVVIKGTAVTGGECRADGVVSPQLLEAVARLPWPEAAPSYMFKLYFVGPAAF